MKKMTTLVKKIRKIIDKIRECDYRGDHTYSSEDVTDMILDLIEENE